jgi:hypothetical protein
MDLLSALDPNPRSLLTTHARLTPIRCSGWPSTVRTGFKSRSGRPGRSAQASVPLGAVIDHPASQDSDPDPVRGVIGPSKRQLRSQSAKSTTHDAQTGPRNDSEGQK